LKFTDAGEVRLTFAAEPGEADGRTRLRLSVSDTGIGMTDDQRGRLFSPFTQAEASTARRFGGTGLGLAISRQLVDVMGGAILVDSTPGRGSVFRIELTLPLAEPPAANAPSPAMPADLR